MSAELAEIRDAVRALAPLDRWATANECASRLGVPPDHVRAIFATGSVDVLTFKEGGRERARICDVDAVLRGMAKPAAKSPAERARAAAGRSL